MAQEIDGTGNRPGGGHPRVAVVSVTAATTLVVAGGYLTTVIAATLASRLVLGFTLAISLVIVAHVSGRPFPVWVRVHIVVTAALVSLFTPLNGATVPIGLAFLPLAGLLRAVRHPGTFWALLWLPVVTAFLAGCMAFTFFVLGAFFILTPLGIDDSWLPGAVWAAANAIAWTTGAVRVVQGAAASWQEGGVAAWLDALRREDAPS